MRFLRISATGLIGLCALAAVLAQGGRWSGFLDLLTHLAPMYLAASILGLVLAIFMAPGRGRIGLAVLSAIAALGAVGLIAPELTRTASPIGRADEGALKLIQFNAEQDPELTEGIVDWLSKEAPDILVLEDSTPHLRASIIRRNRLNLTCAVRCDVAIFSRAKPSRAEGFGGGSYGMDPRLAVAQFAPDDGGYIVVGAHLSRPLGVAKRSRTEMARVQSENRVRMMKIIGPLPRTRMIVAGDFNTTPWSFALRTQDKVFGMERRTRALFSWPANWVGPPFLPIDHVYAGAGWRTVSIEHGPRLGSDHYPVVAVLVPSAGDAR